MRVMKEMHYKQSIIALFSIKLNCARNNGYLEVIMISAVTTNTCHAS